MLSEGGEESNAAVPQLSEKWFLVLGVCWAGGQLEWCQVHSESVLILEVLLEREAYWIGKIVCNACL